MKCTHQDFCSLHEKISCAHIKQKGKECLFVIFYVQFWESWRWKSQNTSWILIFNVTKGDFDTADEMLRAYSTKATSRRWSLAVFFNLLDVGCLEAYVICKAVGI